MKSMNLSNNLIWLFFQAVRHSGRQNIDSCNDKTFGSSECSGQEMAEEERRRRGKISWPYIGCVGRAFLL